MKDEALSGVRGWQVALYPTQEQATYLRACQRELAAAWNVMVVSFRTMLDYRSRAKEDGSHAPTWREWSSLRPVRGPRVSAGSYYAHLRAVCGGRIASAQMYLSLSDTFEQAVSNFMSGRALPPAMKRPDSTGEYLDMPLLNRTGGVAVSGVDEQWGGEGPARWCSVAFGRERIRAKYWRGAQGVRWLEGVSIRLDGTRWVASLRRVGVPERELAQPERGSAVGVNLGLIHTATGVDSGTGGIVFKLPGVRTRDYLLEQARLDEAEDRTVDAFDRARLRERRRRFAARWARKARHQILETLLPAVSAYETIAVACGADDPQRSAAQGPQCRIGKFRGGYVSAMGEALAALKARYGDRVREVEWSGVSQQCSQCGGPLQLLETPEHFCRCTGRTRRGCAMTYEPVCLDETAARNVLRRLAELEVAAE